MLQVATGDVAVLTNHTQFSRLFEAYHGLVFRTAYRITGSVSDAEDVLQTIFLRLIRRDTATKLEKEESYFRRAAVNASLDLLRARKSDSSLPLQDLPASTGERDRREIQESLRRAFAQLSPRSAEIFALRYLEDYSNAQIAEMLGMSQVLVAVTLHRTRGRLQKEIRSYFGDKP
ncbi:MAG TPA: sigma-70 family RNA polymerase sigma factor [Bryobacteraceae bacterium]|nr:sigma-70 family RNA polymerase sigma factor [Bryobacteraceae bacterium]